MQYYSTNAKFSYRIVHDTVNQLWIEDTSNEIGGKSITNAAEEVISDLFEKGLLTSTKRVYYTDTNGDVDELRHANGRFVGFAPGTIL